MGILKKHAPSKKKESVLDSIIAATVRSHTTFEQIEDCIRDVENDDVIDTDIFNVGGNIADFINPRWQNLAKALWRQRSAGLGTPNAASGEGELMFLFLSPKIKKPKRGDLIVGGQKIELKASDARIMGRVSGKIFRKRTLEVCKKFNLTPNFNKVCLQAVELEKRQHLDHWNYELNKLKLYKQEQFVDEWFLCLNEDGNGNFNQKTKCNMFSPFFNHSMLLKNIALKLYSDMVDNEGFDKFVILGNGENVKVVKGCVWDLSQKIDDAYINLKTDYFRVNQDTNIGWYIN